MSAVSAALERYARLFETLTLDRLPELARLLAADIEFQDPFNRRQGRDAVIAIFRHMFETLEEPRFDVLDRAEGETAAYLRWRMRFRRRGQEEVWSLEGVSEVAFDEEGLVRRHIDHWDAGGQVYERVPLIGAALRYLRRRLAAPG